MLAKTGRPPLENPRDYRITVRVDKDEKENLEAICEMTGKGKNGEFNLDFVKNIGSSTFSMGINEAGGQVSRNERGLPF